MSGHRHLRLAALIIGALGAMRLLWLALEAVQAAAPSGLWMEAAFYGLMIVTAVRLIKGSELAWFGAVVLYASGLVVGIETLLDLILASETLSLPHVMQTLLLLAVGGYGVWALLLSPRVKAVRATHLHRDPFALATSVAVAISVIVGIGWYVDRLSPAIQRAMAIQIGIAALFIVLVAFLAARNRRTPVRWEFLPLALAAVAMVANLETIVQLRELRPVAAALRDTPPKSIDELAGVIPAETFAITSALDKARQQAVVQMEAHTGILGPWPAMEALVPEKVTDPATVDAAAASVDAKITALHGAVATYDTILARFAERRRKIISPLADPIYRRLDVQFQQEEDAYRSHYGARVNLLSRAATDLAAMLKVLKSQRGHYTADWNGTVTFADTAAGEKFNAHRASLEELVVWNSRLRAEGATLAAGKPAWGWLAAVD